MIPHIAKLPSFRKDLREIFVYLGERNVDAAKRFLTAVRHDCRALREMPGKGARREFKNARLREIRSWPVSGFRNYLILYRFTDDLIEFVRVVHGARDIDRLFGEPTS